MSTYMCPFGSDSPRLTLQSNVLAKHTQEHLQKAGIHPEAIIADVGCGNGMISCYLLDKVKTIYAVDASTEQLEIAKQNIERTITDNNIQNPAKIVYIQADVTKNLELPEAVDFVFIRLVLTHINKQYYEHFVNNLFNVIKPGGKLLNEEPINKLYCNTYEDLFSRLAQFITNMFISAGNDWNVGSKLAEIYGSKFGVEDYDQVEVNADPIVFKQLRLAGINSMKIRLANQLNPLILEQMLKFEQEIIDTDMTKPGTVAKLYGGYITMVKA